MSISNVNKYPISQLFDPDYKGIFEIPKYQREYTWGSAQWEALFDDLIENDEGYFLGSIICINTTTDAINAPKFEVVDGQQRLTTLSLLFAALYKVLNSNKDLLDEDQQSDILQLKRKLVLKKTLTDIRVVPQVQGNNRDDYRGLLASIGIIPQFPLPKFAGNRRIVKAYNYFHKRISDILDNSENKVAKMFSILEKINSAIMVKIEVSSHADAYVLFESLNNRGTPLTSVDLIKNLLLARLDVGSNKDLDYYFTRWTEILDNLGEDYSTQERFFRQNYNAFRKSLNAPFVNKDEHRQYPLGTIATRSTMLNIYEKIITKSPVTALDELSENTAIYAGIILNKTEELTPDQRDCYQNLQRVQGAPAYLLLMYLIKNCNELGLCSSDIVQICRLLINFFVRRNLTDIPPTRDLARMFMAYIEEIEQKEYRGETIYENLRATLISRSASDEIFEKKLYGPVYDDNSDATRFILCMMAQRSTTIENVKDLWRKTDSNQYVWSIEHIFPQGEEIPQPWVDMIAGGDRDLAKKYQTQYVHTFGNLTITGYNSSLSNKSFADKKERKNKDGKPIGYRNGLNLNSDVCDKDKWTIDIIIERTKRMVNDILQMFAL